MHDGGHGQIDAWTLVGDRARAGRGPCGVAKLVVKSIIYTGLFAKMFKHYIL